MTDDVLGTAASHEDGDKFDVTVVDVVVVVVADCFSRLLIPQIKTYETYSLHAFSSLEF